MTAQQQLLRYFAADELHIQHYLRRHFEWHENALWLEDIPARLLQPLEVVTLSLTLTHTHTHTHTHAHLPRHLPLSFSLSLSLPHSDLSRNLSLEQVDVRAAPPGGVGVLGSSRCRVCVVVGEADSFIDAPSVIKRLLHPRSLCISPVI